MHAQEEVEEAEAKLSEAENSHSHGAVRAFFAQFCTPVFLEALILTFLGGAPCTWLAHWLQAHIACRPDTKITQHDFRKGHHFGCTALLCFLICMPLTCVSTLWPCLQ